MKKITLSLMFVLVSLCAMSKVPAFSGQQIIEGKNMVKYVLSRSFTIIHSAYVENTSYSNQYLSEISGHTSGPTYFDLYPCGEPGHTTCNGYFPEFELDGSGIIKIRVSPYGFGSRECHFLVDGNTVAIKCYSLDLQGDYYVFSLSGIDLSYPRQFQFYAGSYGNCPL